MSIKFKVSQVLFTCIITLLLFISCSDSGTNTAPPEETGPSAPLTGLDNYPEYSEVPIIVELRDSPTRIDLYLPGDPEFEFRINEELISFERDTIYDSGPTEGVHYFNFEKSIPLGEVLDLELVYQDKSYKHTLPMPYNPEIQIPDSLNEGEELEITWSTQEDPAFFLFNYSYAVFDEEFNVVDSGGETFQLNGSDRSFILEQEIISEMSNADTWNISLSPTNYCYWEEDEVLFRLWN